MEKYNIKQIYLLSIVVLGLITLSAYSTYSIFTFESSTSNIISINTPDSLNLALDLSEYRLVVVPKNSSITTDIDIYNNHNYELCYSIWYKAISNNTNILNKIKVYENTSNTLLTSATIDAFNSRRINLLITNDNDEDIKVKIGLAYSKNDDTCNLNINNDYLQVGKIISNSKELSSYLINNTQTENIIDGYHSYSHIDESIELSKEHKIYVSERFNIGNELFTLNNPTEINANDIAQYESYYSCLYNTTCDKLVKILKTKEVTAEDNITKNYYLTSYDEYIPYLSGEIGLRKIDNNYYYYGDNPKNYVYYNCTNEYDNSTCEKWRILGFTYDKATQKYLTTIIRDAYLIDSIFSNNIAWNNSAISDYLNNDYKFHTGSYLKEMNFKQENLPSTEDTLANIATTGNDIKTYIRIISLTEYLNASVCSEPKLSEYTTNCLKNNWLNKGKEEWTTSTKIDEKYTDPETNEEIVPENNLVYAVGNKIELTNISTKLNIRPVVSLSSRVFLVDGDGTFENPYVIR